MASFSQKKAILSFKTSYDIHSFFHIKGKLIAITKFDLEKEYLNLLKTETTCLNSTVLPSTAWYLTSLYLVISVLVQNAAMTFLRRDPSLLGFDRSYFLPIETSPL